MSDVDKRNTPMELLNPMFQLELEFLASDKADDRALARAFHPDMIVTSLRYCPIAASGRAWRASLPCCGR
ncbi:hypothetical protein [Rhizobium lentis]|uniref:hypothetical protein n=1 Tax=Rhizobium lentis TaxID=1138194 RepID=UPI001FE9A974|nr:hypothetical protein [Rhizobium lentis]